MSTYVYRQWKSDGSIGEIEERDAVARIRKHGSTEMQKLSAAEVRDRLRLGHVIETRCSRLSYVRDRLLRIASAKVVPGSALSEAPKIAPTHGREPVIGAEAFGGSGV